MTQPWQDAADQLKTAALTAEKAAVASSSHRENGIPLEIVRVETEPAHQADAIGSSMRGMFVPERFPSHQMSCLGTTQTSTTIYTKAQHSGEDGEEGGAGEDTLIAAVSRLTIRCDDCVAVSAFSECEAMNFDEDGLTRRTLPVGGNAKTRVLTSEDMQRDPYLKPTKKGLWSKLMKHQYHRKSARVCGEKIAADMLKVVHDDLFKLGGAAGDLACARQSSACVVQVHRHVDAYLAFEGRVAHTTEGARGADEVIQAAAAAPAPLCRVPILYWSAKRNARLVPVKQSFYGVSDGGSTQFLCLLAKQVAEFRELLEREERGGSRELDILKKMFAHANSRYESVARALGKSSFRATPCLTCSLAQNIRVHRDPEPGTRERRSGCDDEARWTSAFYPPRYPKNKIRSMWRRFAKLRESVSKGLDTDSEEFKRRAADVVQYYEQGNHALPLHLVDAGVKLPPSWLCDVQAEVDDEGNTHLVLIFRILHVVFPAGTSFHGTEEKAPFMHRRACWTLAPVWSGDDDSSKDVSVEVPGVGSKKRKLYGNRRKMSKDQVTRLFSSDVNTRGGVRIGENVSLFWPHSLRWVDAVVRNISRESKTAHIEFVGEFTDAHVPLDVLARPVADWEMRELEPKNLK